MATVAEAFEALIAAILPEALELERRLREEWRGDILDALARIDPALRTGALTARGLPASDMRALSLRVAFYGFCVLIVSSILGSSILAFFGISLPALRIAYAPAPHASREGMPPAPARAPPQQPRAPPAA